MIFLEFHTPPPAPSIVHQRMRISSIVTQPSASEWLSRASQWMEKITVIVFKLFCDRVDATLPPEQADTS